ncbi:MAG: hypothetical protein V1794_03430 [Candidatus Glassbacteria bacterium]
MSMTIQVIIAISLAVIALYFLLLTVITVLAYFKIRVLKRYIEGVVRDKLEITLEHVNRISERMVSLTDDTAGKVEELTEVVPELRDKVQELIDLLDLVQSKLRNPLLNIVSVLKVFSEKIGRWSS